MGVILCPHCEKSHDPEASCPDRVKKPSRRFFFGLLAGTAASVVLPAAPKLAVVVTSRTGSWKTMLVPSDFKNLEKLLIEFALQNGGLRKVAFTLNNEAK